MLGFVFPVSAAGVDEQVAPLVKVGEFRMKEARTGAAAIVHDDVIYILGGSSGGGAITTIEKFDTRTAEVTSVTSDLVPRRYHSLIEHEGKFYLFGGEGYTLGVDRYERNVEIFDPDSGSVVMGPIMEQARAHMGSVKLDGKAYFIGGSKRVGQKRAQTNNVEVFNFETGKWSKGVPMPTPREAPAVVVTGFVLVPGGYRNSEGVTAVEMFSPEAKGWKELPPLVRRTSAHTAVFLGEHLFLLGDYFERDTVVAYNLRTRESVVHKIPGYRGMRHAAAVVWRERIYVIGGNTATEAGNETDLIQVFAPNPKYRAGTDS